MGSHGARHTGIARPALAALILAALASAGAARSAEAAAEAVPYGHADFYPTAERPAQLRGDGTGHFPAATPITRWDFRTGEGIVWRCRLPGWGYSSPIVVGDKAFVTCDWNKLVCVDVRTGQVLWVRDNDTFDLVGGAKADELRALFNEVTGDWLEAWQCCWEIAYLTWKLDVIAAAKAGTDFEWPSGGYGHTGHTRKGANMAPDHVTPAEMKGVLAKAAAMSDAQVAQIETRLAALQERRQANQWGPNVSAYVPRLSPYVRGSEKEEAYKARIKDALKTLTPYGLFTDFWNGWMSASFPTPASDGQHVYVQFSQCQVACYDLDGNRKWLRAFTKEAVTSRLDQNYSASPILAGDKLIVMFGGKEDKGSGQAWTMVRALDKRTGELVWQRKVLFWHTSHAFPQVMRVRHAGIDALATSASNILRTADGEVVLDDLPTSIAPPLVHEGEVYLTSGSGESTGGGTRMKVVLEGSGQDLRAKAVWGFLPDRHKGFRWYEHAARHFPEAKLEEFEYGTAPITNVGCIYHDGRIIYGADPGLVIDAATGAQVAPEERGGKRRLAGGAGRGHLSRAGPNLVTTCGDTVVRVHDLADPGRIVAVNHLGSEWHRQVQLLELSGEEAVAAIKDLPWFPYAASWSLMQTTPWPQGDRLYIRVKDTLYCVGDPTKPYHSPAGAP